MNLWEIQPAVVALLQVDARLNGVPIIADDGTYPKTPGRETALAGPGLTGCSDDGSSMMGPTSRPNAPTITSAQVLVHGQPVVLLPVDAPVQEVEVVPLPAHVLDEGRAGLEVEDRRPADAEVRHEQDRHRARARRLVPVQPGLVPPVDDLLGREADPGLGRGGCLRS